MDITFIHIPKTGGSALKKELEKCPSIRSDIDYKLKRHQVKSSDVYNSFTIVRHPLDRFVSASVFALRGSEKFLKYKKHVSGINDLSTFVNSLRDDKDPLHRRATSIYRMKKKNSGWTAFDPQTDWIDKDTKIICYDKNNLNANVNHFLKTHDMDCEIDLQHVNVTKKYNFDITLSEEQIQWVQDKYKDDYTLWETHCG